MWDIITVVYDQTKPHVWASCKDPHRDLIANDCADCSYSGSPLQITLFQVGQILHEMSK